MQPTTGDLGHANQKLEILSYHRIEQNIDKNIHIVCHHSHISTVRSLARARTELAFVGYGYRKERQGWRRRSSR